MAVALIVRAKNPARAHDFALHRTPFTDSWSAAAQHLSVVRST